MNRILVVDDDPKQLDMMTQGLSYLGNVFVDVADHPEEAKRLMNKHRLERVLVVNDSFELRGLVTVKDIMKATEHPNACKDSEGKLRVGAAVGVGPDNDERVELLVKAGVDLIVVDTAHGHSQGVLDRVKWVKKHYPQVQVIGGNIATGDAALYAGPRH